MQLQGFVTHCEMSGNFSFCPPNTVLWKQRLNRSDPAVFSPNTLPGKRKTEFTSSCVTEEPIHRHLSAWTFSFFLHLYFPWDHFCHVLFTQPNKTYFICCVSFLSSSSLPPVTSFILLLLGSDLWIFTFSWFFLTRIFLFLYSLLLSADSLSERSKPKRGGEASTNSDDYAYPPPPIPLYSQSLPNSPLLYKKRGTGGHLRDAPTLNMASAKVHTAPVSPTPQCPKEQLKIRTCPLSTSHYGFKAGSHNKYQEEFLNPSTLHQYSHPPYNGCKAQPIQTQKGNQDTKSHQPGAQLNKQCSVEELRSTVQTVVSTIEHSSQDVRQLGQKMVAATEMIADSVEENAQAVNVLAEVVEKLQGIIVAKKQHRASGSTRAKQNPPTPPPRVSSLSPKVVRKPPTPYPISPSQLSSCSSSSSVSSGSEDFGGSQSRHQQNKSHRVTQRAGGCGSNGHVWFDNGTVSRAHMEEQQEPRSTGCLQTMKRRKKK